MNQVFLNEIHYHLDKQKNINQLSETIEKSKIEYYKRGGVEHYYTCTLSLIDYASKILTDMFNTSHIEGDDIDHVIFVSDSIHKNAIGFNIREIGQLLKKNGMEDATFSKLTGAQCANTSLALQSAFSYVKSGVYDEVLVVSVESRFSRNEKEYLMSPEMSILSDAGIAFRVSSSQEINSLEICGIKLLTDHNQWGIDQVEEFQKFTINKLKLYKGIARWAYRDPVWKESVFFFNNYFHHISKMFKGVFKLDENQVYSKNLIKFGHTEAGDTFINLKCFLEENGINNGQFVLISDSPTSCIGIKLKRG